MQDLAIYALLNGVFTTASLHHLDEVTVRLWLKALDYENIDFFKAVREFIVKSALKVGPDKVAELLALPVWTVRTLVSEFGPSLAGEVGSSAVSLSEYRRRALLLHAQGFDEEFIAASTQLPVAQIIRWIDKQPTKPEVKPKDDDLFDQMREEAALHRESD